MLRQIDLTDPGLARRVVAIQKAAYRVEAKLIGFDEIPVLHETVDELRTLDLQWMGSWENDLLVGIIAWTTIGWQCEIDRLAVDPAFSRRGHGRALIDSLAFHRTVVVTTGTLNIPALRLYESSGFVQVNEREIAPGVTVTNLRRQTQPSVP